MKIEERLPAARAFIREHKLNEMIAGDVDDIGIIVMGGLTNSVLRALERVGLADVFGASRVPLLVLNVVYPLVPEEIREFCAGKRAVLIVEEGSPDYIEQAVNVELRRADLQTKVYGKGPLPAGRRILLRRAARGPRRLPASRKAPRQSTPTPSPKRRAASSRTRQKLRLRSGRCRRARPPSAPAAPNGRCSRPSS